MSINVTNASVSGVNPLSLSSMDIESALMMVQAERTKLLDAQLKDQIAAVQGRNAMLSSMNQMSASLNGLKSLLPSGDAQPGDKVPSTATAEALATEYATQAFKLGLEPSPVSATPIKDATGTIVGATVTGLPDRQDLEKGITSLKSKIDAASNSQQMDMLRLQSMTNKRNEAFDVMTNFVKKMQDSRSSLISNMR